MVQAAPPPATDKLDLQQLHRLALAFDQIGDELGGARYPAVAFVKWIGDEYDAARWRASPQDVDAA